MSNNFDRVAAVYPLLESLSFGDELNRARRAFLADACDARDILLVGEGNGRFLHECLGCHFGARITVVDLSRRMLDSARRSAAADRQGTTVEFVQADFLTWSGPSGTYDLIHSHFFLDLFLPHSQQVIIENIGRLTKPDAPWVDVDYRCPRAGRLARVIDWLQYRFDRTFCGVEADRHYDPAEQIFASGWRVTDEQIFAKGNVASRIYRRMPGRNAARFSPR